MMGAQAVEKSVEVSSARLSVSKAKTDVLGRHNSKVQNTPQAYVKNMKPMALAKAADYPSEVAIRKTVGEFRYKAFKNSKKYILDGDTISESTYTSRINQIEQNDDPRFNFVYSYSVNFPTYGSNYNFATQGAVSPCANQTFCEADILTHRYGQAEHITFMTVPYVAQNLSKLGPLYNKGAQGNNIGIHFLDVGVPSAGFVPSNKLTIEADCAPSTYVDNKIAWATKVARTMNAVAPGATIHAYSTNCNDYSRYGDIAVPVDAFYKTPQIHVGSLTPSGQSGNTTYGDISSAIDEIIYQTRIIEFAGAGDEGLFAGNPNQLSQFAMGVNVITVGAVHNNGLTYHQTSSWKNAAYPVRVNESLSGSSYIKPEIANFSDFFFPDARQYNITVPNQHSPFQMNPYYLQTSAASAYTAASVALLLEKYPFYRWHPEVVKALLLTSSSKPISQAWQHDDDNGIFARNYLNDSLLIGKNRSRFWNGNNEDFFVNNQPITFTEKDIKANKTYRVAIAWLSSGVYIKNSGVLPQDIDIRVMQNGTQIGSSRSEDNAYELVEFTTNSASNVEIIISRHRNRGGRVLLGYNFAEI